VALNLRKEAGDRREGWVTGASYRGGHWLTSYSSYFWLLAACNNVVNRLQRGAIAMNGDFHGDDRPTTSWRKWVRRQGDHSAPTSSLARDLLPYVVIRVPSGTNRRADEDRGAGSSAVRYTKPAIFFRLLYNGMSIQCAWQSNLKGLVLKFLCSNSLIHLWQSWSSTNQLEFCHSN
jgi:hypothetical protein